MIFGDRVIASSSALPPLVNEALMDVPYCADLLDVGAGNGRLADVLRGRRSDISVTGLEYDAELAQMPESKQHQRVVVGSADVLPFADESFDAVIAVNTLHEVVAATSTSERLEKLHNTALGISRVLRSDGQFIMYDGLMPSNESEEVTIEPRSNAAYNSLQKFAREYLARPAQLAATDGPRFKSDMGTVVTFLTKYAYLDGNAWEGEREQLYPFATPHQLSATFAKAGLLITEAHSPWPQSRRGLGRLLGNFSLLREGNEPYTMETFPATQILIKAKKQNLYGQAR